MSYTEYVMPPPHCPNPKCSHFHADHGSFPHVRIGFHATKAFGRVQRYRCKGCGASFSDQTFAITYYTKQTVNLWMIFEHLVTGSGLMDMARSLKIRPETVQNRIERMARCAIAIHTEILAEAPMTEDQAADGFASFSFSQYFPNTVDHFTGCESEFIYATGLSNLRRSGRMTEHQRRRRAALEMNARADGQATRKSMQSLATSLVQLLTEKEVGRITLHTDEHKAYPQAFRRVTGFEAKVHHVATSSRRARTRDNPLFPVNYVDRQFRKDLSDHRRETVQFARCPSALMARLVLYRHYHNYIIHRRLREYRRGDETTHAERAGINEATITRCIGRHWMKRVFLGRVNPAPSEAKTWFCRWRNPGIEMGRYTPGYIAA